jgi:hypothetical protein
LRGDIESASHIRTFKKVKIVLVAEVGGRKILGDVRVSINYVCENGRKLV